MTGVLAPLLAAFAKLPGAHFFEGARAVARREVLSNLKSLRMIVVTALVMLAIVGGGAGISALGGGQPGAGQNLSTVVFANPAWPDGPNGSAGAAIFVSDAWGQPRPGVEVVLVDTSTSQTTDGVTTDANGMALVRNLVAPNPSGPPADFTVAYRLTPNTMNVVGRLTIPPGPVGFSADTKQFDLAGNGSSADLVLQAVAEDGSPLAGAQVLNGTQPVATLDSRGYAHLVLPPGQHELVLEYAGAQATLFARVGEPQPSFLAGGANQVMAFVAAGFIPLIVPIVTIAIAHDAIARERAQGSLDLVLSRPSTRWGVLLGKFAGTLVSLLVPVYGAIALGAAAIGAITGKGIDGVFFAGILVGVTGYVAAYSLILLILSTLAKTTGTAVMLGVTLWLVYNLLWGVIVFFVTLAAGLTPADRAYYEVSIYASFFNVNDLYNAVLALTYPGNASNPFTFDGQEIVPAWAPPAAFAAWLVGLFLLALWVFDRRAAE